jgi:hypothetical protein
MPEPRSWLLNATPFTSAVRRSALPAGSAEPASTESYPRQATACKLSGALDPTAPPLRDSPAAGTRRRRLRRLQVPAAHDRQQAAVGIGQQG